MRTIVKPAVFWLTGLSCSGKTTLANSLAERFRKTGIDPVILDGDDIRNYLDFKKFDEESRIRHNLYVGYFASLFEKKGQVVIVALISPYADIRNRIRSLCHNFIEVYVATRIEVCIRRDLKGLYEKAVKGEIQEFTGISSPYHPPSHPEITVDNGSLTIVESTDILYDFYVGHLKVR